MQTRIRGIFLMKRKNCIVIISSREKNIDNIFREAKNVVWLNITFCGNISSSSVLYKYFPLQKKVSYTAFCSLWAILHGTFFCVFLFPILLSVLTAVVNFSSEKFFLEKYTNFVSTYIDFLRQGSSITFLSQCYMGWGKGYKMWRYAVWMDVEG